jgi:O-Antigen ligase
VYTLPRMRRVVQLTAAAVLLAGSTVLAFFSGGYFDGPRLVATLVAWVLVLVVAATAQNPLPASRAGRAALAGLALIVVWTGLSITWAPLSEQATASFVRVLLYLGALIAAAGVLREEGLARAVEPALALGTVVVIGYGLAGRLLPGIVKLTESAKAFGRLEQPITYWNAEGALAAIGLVLCVRLAGTSMRPAWLGALAAAAAAPLGMGVYLSYSRGAIAAAVVGLVLLLALAPTQPQLRAAAIGLGAALLAAGVSAAFPGVATLEGSPGERESDGIVAFVLLIAVMAVAGLVQAWTANSERERISAGRLAVERRLPAIAGVVLVVGLAGLVAAGLRERGSVAELSREQGVSRLASVESRRYDYWDVGLRAFASEPLMGLGAGGFRVEWLRERPVRENALEAHSLVVEMAAELGLPGLLGLALLVGGVFLAGRQALRRSPTLAPGLSAGATVWALHAVIDWDWQLPAVTLPAVVMAGALVALSEGADPASVSRAG